MKKTRLLLIFLVLLAISHGVRLLWQDVSVRRHAGPSVELVETKKGEPTGRPVSLAYRDIAGEGIAPAPVAVLVRGIPLRNRVFDPLVEALGGKIRVIVPDLPGWGKSTYRVADYSIKAYADYLRQFLAKLALEEPVHVVACGQGAAVAVHLAHAAPEKVASLTLLGGTGVQENQLLGDYMLNHAIYALQLSGIWVLQQAIPHFGLADHSWWNMPFAHHSLQSDHRPLRGILKSLPMPVLIVHAEDDIVVPLEAAKEHQRLIPQSELLVRPGGHNEMFVNAGGFAPDIARFIESVEAGEARTRANADPGRVAHADDPYKPQPAGGFSLLALILLIALATLVSEDLTCVGAGLLVLKGIVSFWAALAGCVLGIVGGDIGLFLLGRWLGRPALRYPPLRWFLTEERVNRNAEWFERNGPALVIATRFLPGSRLPAYFAAGMMHMKLMPFGFYFLIATLLWTPMLIGLSMLIGSAFLDWFKAHEKSAIWVVLALVVTVWIVLHTVIPLFSYRGRRLFLSRWRRLTRWEFWPIGAIYLPLFFYWIFLSIRYRSLTLFTAVNPGIFTGGFVQESKREIFEGFKDGAGGAVPLWAFIEHSLSVEEKWERARGFLDENGLDFPVILKPNIGQRGQGVAVVRSESQARGYLESCPEDVIVQEFIEGVEFGVFYYRFPSEEKGRIFAITDKRFPTITADGESTLERLILEDNRAVCCAKMFLARFEDSLYTVPPKGSVIKLTDLGTHARGSLFLDGADFHSPELESEIDRISKSFDGFHFGRYDIRVASNEDFRAGRGLKVIELNGVTSEATNMYDPKHGLLFAWKTLFRQWGVAYAIGAANRERGAKPTSMRTLMKVLWRYFRGKPYEASQATAVPEKRDKEA